MIDRTVSRLTDSRKVCVSSVFKSKSAQAPGFNREIWESVRDHLSAYDPKEGRIINSNGWWKIQSFFTGSASEETALGAFDALREDF